MKPFSLYWALVIFFFFVTCDSLFAQKGYQKGYVVTSNNDTLLGLLKDRKPSELLQKIRFKGEKIKRRYGPTKIVAYKIGDRYYESIWIDKESRFLKENVSSIPGQGRKVFLRVMEKGALTHYLEEFQEQGDQLVQEIDYFKKKGRPQLIRVTQGLFGLKRKQVMAFLSDCPSLVDKIERKTLKYAFEVAHYYNHVCPIKN